MLSKRRTFCGKTQRICAVSTVFASGSAKRASETDAMKTIIKRLCRLENRVASPDFQGPIPAEVLLERRRRWSEVNGLPFRPPEPLCPHGKRIADVLRSR